MPVPIGVIAALFRYPVKSMAAEPLAAAELGFHGLAGDRRLAFRRLPSSSNRPWLTASTCPDLIRYVPDPSHSSIRTPAGSTWPVFSDDLAADVSRRCGEPVQMMQFVNGIFDDADISLISTATIAAIARLAGLPLDPRRFRPNLLLHLTNPAPFQEDAWLGSLLTLGDGPAAPQIAVTQHDIRCSMVNLDPDTAASSPAVQKAILRANQHRAGAYAATLRPGPLTPGATVYLHTPTAP